MADFTIHQKTEVTSLANADEFLVWVAGSSVTRRITKANALSGYATAASNVLTLPDGKQITFPATGTAALLGVNNTFTGIVRVQDNAIYGRYSTNDALAYLGLDNNLTAITIGQNQTMTVTLGSGAVVSLLLVNINGRAALFVVGQVSGTMNMTQDGEGLFEQSASPSAGKIGVWKSANSQTVGIKNNYGSSRLVSIVAIGSRITAYGAPA